MDGLKKATVMAALSCFLLVFFSLSFVTNKLEHPETGIAAVASVASLLLWICVTIFFCMQWIKKYINYVVDQKLVARNSQRVRIHWRAGK